MKESGGGDKTMIPFCGLPLYLYQYEKMRSLFTHVFLVAKQPTLFAEHVKQHVICDLSSIEDKDTSELFAPTLGIYSALTILEVPYVFFIAVDMPFVTEYTIQRIIADGIAKNSVAAVASYAGKKQPTCALYGSGATQALCEAIKTDNHKLMHFLDKIDTISVDIENGDELRNLNTFAEYKKAYSGIDAS